ncbi:sensor histidine kinase [Nocardiopsis tropica]|uniref:histidine kinase n=1 Tax=Nocardiopsis tropica TaxID=109330 RepID=A0ABU7KP69_9ACTN|nr:histidine kinase [Nocardiopsis umidischolae]MEE2051093.1 histidine kinase [Nocardiopsis umidischolae]
MGAAEVGETFARRRWRWRWLPVPVRDAVVAVLVGLVVLEFSPVEGSAEAGWLSHTVVLLACAPLVLRRRFPLTAVLATGALSFVSYVTVGYSSPLIAAMFAAASAAYRRPGAVPVLAAAGVACWSASQVILFPDTNGMVEWSGDPSAPAASMTGNFVGFALGTLPVLIPVLAGYVWRLRADRAEGVRREARNAFEYERLRERERIAREVHDIAGHHLSAIRLLAVGGRQAVAGRDPEAVAVLGSVADLSGRAVREVRELLEALREDRLTGAVPGTGLADLASLVAALEGTGVNVELVMSEGVGEGLSERVEADAYRIVQESLGNVLRHSSARRVRVRVTRTADALTVMVEDDGWRIVAAEGSGGRGLAGMRERVRELGGVLEAGNRPGRGWRVRAVLPAEGVRTDSAASPGTAENTRNREGAHDPAADRRRPASRP